MKCLFRFFVLAAPLCAQDVLTQHNDNARTGCNPRETALTVAGVSARFGKLWHLPADGQITAQPLYISRLNTKRCPAGCNTVVFATMNNTVYAYDADRRPDSRNSTLFWARWLGPPQPNYDDERRNFDVFFTNDPAWGILSTPVIDRASGVIYLVSWHPDNGGALRLHALNLADGSDRLPPRDIDASSGNKRLDPACQKQRAGLLLDRGVLYIGFASARENNEDARSGWVLAYDAATLKKVAAWCSTPSGTNGGIWASGQGLAADRAGNIYVATGNGTFDESPKNRRNYGGSLVRLRLELVRGNRELRVQEAFTPCGQQALAEQDLDLGSAGPVLFGHGAHVVVGGKQGLLYTMPVLKLGGYLRPPSPGLACRDGPGVLSTVRASQGHIYGSPVYWEETNKSWIYVWGVGGRLRAFPVQDGMIRESGAGSGTYDLAAEQVRFGKEAPGDPCVHNALADAWMPGGVLSVSSDGKRAGTGIVWAVVPANGDANRCRGIRGMLMAFDAADVSRELWRSQRRDSRNNDGPDSLGLLARFAAPTIAGGKVFLATFGDFESRDFYHHGKRPKVRYPRAPGEFPRWYSVAVYGLK